MDVELEMAWKELQGSAAALSDLARRVRTGEGNADPNDPVPPRDKLDNVLAFVTTTASQIKEIEANPNGPWSWQKQEPAAT